MTENMLELRNQTPSEGEFQRLLIVSKNAAASGLYGGIGNEQKIFMILLAARELGIPPMTALNGGLWNIQGKIEISARMINAMLRKAGISISIKRMDAKGCILEGKRQDNGDSCIVQFLEEDAARAGVLGRKPWKENPEDMYFARAISKLGRRLAPDILGTAYVEGEIKDSKCEIIETKMFQEVDINTEETSLTEYLQGFSEDVEMRKEYLKKYANYWKKSITQTIEDYQDRDKFDNDYIEYCKL